MATRWPLVPISKIATPVLGGTPSRMESDYWDGEIKWATAKDIACANQRYIYETNETISELGMKNSSAKILPKGTVVITARGTVGSLAQLGVDMAINQSCYGLLPNEGIDQDYLYYALKEAMSKIRALSYGTVFETITMRTFDNLYVSNPPLKYQRAIAHILGTLDDKIELNRRMNETLDAIARAIFKSWFIDFDPVRAKAEGRDPGLPKHIADNFPDSFEKTLVGRIPAGWSVAPIGEKVNCLGGSTPSTKEDIYWNNGTIPFITPKDMSRLTSPVIMDTERYITELGAQVISSGVLPAGTLLLSSRAPIGYLAITTIPATINQGIIALICDGSLPAGYVFEWIKVNIERIKAVAGGTTFAEISKSSFRNIQIVIPSKRILDFYTSFFESIFQLIIKNEKENRILALLRDLLLPKLISGEIKIKDAERFIERIT